MTHSHEYSEYLLCHIIMNQYELMIGNSLEFRIMSTQNKIEYHVYWG